MRATSLSLTAAMLGTALIAACAMNEMPDAREGATVYAENCSTCHGPRGLGDGPIAAELAIAPPDLTKIADRNGGAFPAAEVLSTIDGYAKGTHQGRVMPEFGIVLGAETVPVDIDGTLTPTPRPLAALLSYLQDIQNP